VETTVFKPYGKENIKFFEETCIPLIYLIAIIRNNLNWGDILSEKLEVKIKKEQEEVPMEQPQFHISSYLLDIMSVLHSFLDMEWKICLGRKI